MTRCVFHLVVAALLSLAGVQPAAGAPLGHAIATLATSGPSDRPVSVRGNDARARFRKRIEPYVKKARASYPGAKRRYLAGLPPGEVFYVTAELVDQERGFEQVFVRVQKIENGTITGMIANDIHVVRGYRNGDTHRVAERDIVDWLISRRDGSEEGNFVGKFLDTQSQSQ
jgi:uncharacterized protein YegJ (DUF2314 family)